MMISDEDLAKTILREDCGNADDPIRWGELRPEHQRHYLRCAGAVRAALCPPVTPLAPGETVMIPDSMVFGDKLIIGTIHDHGDTCLLESVCRDESATIALDAAGVQALIDVARRWQAAQEGE